MRKEYEEYKVFTARDELTLSDRALAFIVGEIAPYNLTATDADVKGIAYQELVGDNLRGDRGQYFTPPDAVKLMVEILDPQEHETVLDPACGTGGFLRGTLRHLLDNWRENEQTFGRPDTAEQLVAHQDRLQAYAAEHLFGADFDPFLVRASSMSVMMLTAEPGNVYYMDSLAFPKGHLPGVKEADQRIPLYDSRRLGSGVDVLMTNPPFGTDIKIEDPEVLAAYAGWRSPLVVPQQGNGAARGRGRRHVNDTGAAVHPACRAVGQAGRADRHRPAKRHPL